MVSGNKFNGDVFVVFNLFTKVDFLVVIGSKALTFLKTSLITFEKHVGSPSAIGMVIVLNSHIGQ